MSELTAQEIATYLQQHPDFFVQHPDVFASLHFGEQSTGVASLQLRQQQLLRQQNTALQQQLQQLVTQAKQNEQVYQVFSACHRLLMNDIEFGELASHLEELICKELALSECKLVKYSDDLQPIIHSRLNNGNHYLGRLSEQEQTLLFDTPCKSAALYLIGEPSSPLALLAFASTNELHFEPAQDSFFIFEFVKALQERIATMP